MHLNMAQPYGRLIVIFRSPAGLMGGARTPTFWALKFFCGIR